MTESFLQGSKGSSISSSCIYRGPDGKIHELAPEAWIACSERLPKDGEKVLVKSPHRRGPAPGYLCGQKSWFIRGQYHCLDMVSHWKPA